jgi:SAM-dependent methyltransferase
LDVIAAGAQQRHWPVVTLVRMYAPKSGDNATVELARYEAENRRQTVAEHDPFTVGRYRQFARFSQRISPPSPVVLDVGCCTGRGGVEYARLRPQARLWGLDVVQDRLDALPPVYAEKIRGLSTSLPLEDSAVDVILAGEFLEHLTPADVDPTLFEFHRVLRIGGRLLLTTPNPRYLRLTLTGGSVYGPGHLTQHYPRLLRARLMTHGFKRVRVLGSGQVSRYLGQRLPVSVLYGSYLVTADKR